MFEIVILKKFLLKNHNFVHFLNQNLFLFYPKTSNNYFRIQRSNFIYYSNCKITNFFNTVYPEN